MISNPGPNPLDLEIVETMDSAFDILFNHPGCVDSADQLRLRIVAHNLKAFAEYLLIADNHPDLIKLDTKKLVLGILGTSDWMLKHLPDLPD